jgi:hypothetical protein
MAAFFAARAYYAYQPSLPKFDPKQTIRVPTMPTIPDLRTNPLGTPPGAPPLGSWSTGTVRALAPTTPTAKASKSATTTLGISFQPSPIFDPH